jgi:hypothetical protein
MVQIGEVDEQRLKSAAEGMALQANAHLSALRSELEGLDHYVSQVIDEPDFDDRIDAAVEASARELRVIYRLRQPVARIASVLTEYVEGAF